MDEQFLRQLAQWHEEDEYRRIIDAIEAIPEEQRGYQLTGQLARAYNNLAQVGEDELFERAAALLLSVGEEGEADPVWHFHLGYAYYYLDREEEAAAQFERCLELNPGDEDAQTLLEACREEIGRKAGNRQEDYDPELYTGEEMEAVEAHINARFGEFDSVYHELVSPDIHVDLCIIPPREGRDCYTIVTMGMGAHRMAVPQELAGRKLDRAELLLCLPPDWKLQDRDERWYWPLRLLKVLARLPGQEKSWLGWGHTVDNSSPYSEDTGLCGAILIEPGRFGEAASVCTLPDGDEVNFYQVLPLYREEMDYKRQYGAEAMLDRLGEEALVVDPLRGNFCDGEIEEKAFAIPPGELEPLLEGWDGPEGCIATDRITVDGCPVGYCYREEPEEGVPDSGWRFTAGDETDEYMDDPSHSGVYSLNTIANYDPDILPLLDSPIGSAYCRDDDGIFVPDDSGRMPTWLEPYARDVEADDGFSFELVSSGGNTLFEIWYYGELVTVSGEPLPYISGTDFAPARVTARDAATGEEILLFDGAAHGYNAMFCDEYTDAQHEDRPLRRYRHPASKIRVRVGCGIDYEEERDDYEFDEDGCVLLRDGSSMPWGQAKRDGIDWFSAFFEGEDGSLVQFIDEELA